MNLIFPIHYKNNIFFASAIMPQPNTLYMYCSTSAGITKYACHKAQLLYTLAFHQVPR